LLIPVAVKAYVASTLLVLDLVGTFVFALSGAVAGVKHRLDLFGVLVLSFAAANAGGITRDVLIGAVPPEAIAHWRAFAIALAGGLATIVGYPLVSALRRPVLVLDAIGLGLFAVTGAQKALIYGIDPAMAAVLGMVSGIGGGMVRDVLVGEIPVVLRGGLYAIPALLGAGIVVLAYRQGNHSVAFPIIGAAVCFAIRMAGLRYDLSLPAAKDVPESVDPRRLRNRERRSK
jgi:uncharacterized membrane protein YeiH